MNGDIKGAIAYMREHEEFKDILPARVAIFENGEYRGFDVPDKLNDTLRLYQIYYRDTFSAVYRKRMKAEQATATLWHPRESKRRFVPMQWKWKKNTGSGKPRPTVDYGKFRFIE